MMLIISVTSLIRSPFMEKERCVHTTQRPLFQTTVTTLMGASRAVSVWLFVVHWHEFCTQTRHHAILTLQGLL